MAMEPDELRLALTQNLYSAPLGTAKPTLGELGADWTHAGYLGEDSQSINPTTDTEQIRAAQSLYAVRQVVTGRALVLSATLLQRNADNLKIAFGGGRVTVDDDIATYHPPADTEIDERSWFYVVEDGANKAGFWLPRGMGLVSGEVAFARADTGFEIEITCLDNPTDLWQLITNEAAVVDGADEEEGGG